MSSTARNLRILPPHPKPKNLKVESDYVPSALETQHNKLVADTRKTRKNLRRESMMLYKTSWVVMFSSLISMTLWVFFGTYVRDILGTACLVVCGLIGLLCVFSSMMAAAVMTSVRFTLETEEKRLSKEV